MKNNKIKKYTLAFGGIVAATIPLATVVACSSSTDDTDAQGIESIKASRAYYASFKALDPSSHNDTEAKVLEGSLHFANDWLKAMAKGEVIANSALDMNTITEVNAALGVTDEQKALYSEDALVSESNPTQAQVDDALKAFDKQSAILKAGIIAAIAHRDYDHVIDPNNPTTSDGTPNVPGVSLISINKVLELAGIQQVTQAEIGIEFNTHGVQAIAGEPGDSGWKTNAKVREVLIKLASLIK